MTKNIHRNIVIVWLRCSKYVWDTLEKFALYLSKVWDVHFYLLHFYFTIYLFVFCFFIIQIAWLFQDFSCQGVTISIFPHFITIKKSERWERKRGYMYCEGVKWFPLYVYVKVFIIQWRIGCVNMKKININSLILKTQT